MSDLRRVKYRISRGTEERVDTIFREVLSPVEPRRTIHPNQDIDLLYDIFNIGLFSNAGKDRWVGDSHTAEWGGRSGYCVRHESNGLGIGLSWATCLMEDGSIWLDVTWSRHGAMSRLCPARDAYAFVSKWQDLLESALRKAAFVVEKQDEY